MLNIFDFTIDKDTDEMLYQGEYVHCTIAKRINNYIVDARNLVQPDCEDIKCQRYVCSSLSTAIQTVEALENGEEV